MGVEGGYGEFRLSAEDSEVPGRPSKVGAHRVAFRIYNGPIPLGPPRRVIRHTCDNTLCVNPAHLTMGTHKENTADMVARGRGGYQKRGYGENNPVAKLSDASVVAIKNDPRSGRTIAADYGVSANHISLIKRGIARKRG